MEIYNELKTYTQEKEMILLLGSEYFQSLIGNKILIPANKLILAADFDITVSRKNNKVQELSYSGLFMVGRKFEDNTFSSVKENFEEKLNNRMIELTETLIDTLGEFACMYGYEIINEKISFQLNKFAQNIDFVAAEVTLLK